MFISPFRRYSSYAVLGILVLLIGGVWYVTHPKRISAMAQALLSNVLGGKVNIASGEVSWSGTLQLTGVTLSTGEGAQELPLFTADQVEVRFNWVSLLVGQLRATQITAMRPTLHLIENQATQRWNYQRLGTGGSGGQGGGGAAPLQLPVIMLRDARVEWGEANGGTITRTGSAVIDGQLTPDPALPTLFRFSMSQRGDLGSAASDVTGSWDVLNNRFTAVTGSIELSESLKRAMPRTVRQWWDEHKLSGRLAQLRMSHEENEGLVLVADLDRVSMVVEVPAPEAMNAKAQVVPFKDVRGSLTFGITRGFVRIGNLRGTAMNQQFQIDGELRGLANESPFDLSVKLTDFKIGEPYPDLLMSSHSGQDLLQRIRPRGKFDLDLSVKRVTPNGTMHVNGELQLKDLGIRFVHFPYPVERMRGKVTFDNQRVYFHNVAGVADEASVRLNGYAGVTHESPGFDITVTGANATFDERFGACLPERFRGVWGRFSFVGKGGFKAVVARPSDPGASYTVKVDVKLQDGHGYHRDFPYRMANITGDLKFEGDKTTVDLAARRNEETVAITGLVEHKGGDLENVRPMLNIKAQKLVVNDELINLLPPETRGWQKQVAVTGTVDVAAALQGEVLTADVQLAGGTLASTDGKLNLTQVNVSAAVDPKNVIIKKATARLDQAELEAVAEYAFATGDFSATLSAKLNGYKLDPMPTYLPETQQQAWRQYQPAGMIDGTAVIKLAGNAANLKADVVKSYEAELALRDVALRPKDWPDTLTQINGQVSLNADGLQMNDMSAKSGPAKLNWSGDFGWAKGGLSIKGKAVAEQMPLKWAKSFPPAVSNSFERAKPEGRVSVMLDRLERRQDVKPETGELISNWNFSGSFSLSTIKSPATLNLEAQEILVTGVGSWRSDRPMFDFAGSLAAKSVAFTKREIDTLTAKLTAGSRDNVRAIRIDEIEGTVADGTTQGSVLITIDPQPRYEANVVLSDADMATLVLGPKAPEAEKKRIGTGRVTASLAVQEDFDGNAGRTGRGDLVVRDGTIYDVPLAMGLMQIATLRLPVSGSFEQATMSYYLRDNKVTFERILLESKGINLAGSGILNLKDNSLDMNFVTESPNELRIPIITTLIRGARNEILQVAVTGTTDNPRVQPVPISSITQTLQALLPKRKREGDGK